MTALLISAGCETAPEGFAPHPDLPPDEVSGLFTTRFAGFEILDHPDAEYSEFRYRLILSPNRPIREPMNLRVVFENPQNPNRPLNTAQQVTPGTESILIRSDPVWGIGLDEIYEIVVHAYDTQGNELGTHRQRVLSVRGQ